LLIALSAFHLLMAGTLAFNRLASPVILDSAEAVHAQFAYQAGAGIPLYGPMDIKIQELWYNPLSFQAAGLVSRFFDYDIRAMRFVMFLFGAGSILLAALITFKMTGNRLLAFIAASWMSAIEAGPWLVEMGPNAGHVFFAMLAVYLILRDESLKWSTVALACVALFASFWCKQTGLAYIAAGVFFFATRDIRKGIGAAAIAGGLAAIGMLYYAAPADSTYIQFTFLHGNHPMIWKWLWNPALYPELLGRFGILCAVVLTGLFLKRFAIREWLRPEIIFLGASAVVGIFTRIKYGSGPSQAIFFYGMIIVCALYFLHRFLQDKKISGAVLAGMLAVQTLALGHDQRSALITPADEFRFREIVDILSTPGQVTYYANHGVLNLYAGKEPFAAMGRDCWHKGTYDRSRYPDYYRQAVSADPFDIVIIDVPLEDNSWFLYERLNSSYQPVRELPALAEANNALRSRKVVLQRKNQPAATRGP